MVSEVVGLYDVVVAVSSDSVKKDVVDGSTKVDDSVSTGADVSSKDRVVSSSDQIKVSNSDSVCSIVSRISSVCVSSSNSVS